IRNRTTWIARKPMGGIPLTKSPMGMALAPFRPIGPAAADSDAVGDDAGEHENHPDDHDEMGGVLAERKAGGDDVVGMRDEAVLRQVEHQPERDHREPELCRPGQWAVGGWSDCLTHSRLHLYC